MFVELKASESEIIQKFVDYSVNAKRINTTGNSPEYHENGYSKYADCNVILRQLRVHLCCIVNRRNLLKLWYRALLQRIQAVVQ